MSFFTQFIGLIALAICMAGNAQGVKPAAAEPDVLVFKNGDQLTGKVVRGVGGNLVFKSDVVGEITVPLDKVKELRSSTSFALLRKGAEKRPPMRADSIAIVDDRLQVPVAGAEAASVPVKDVGYLIDQATYDRELAHQPFMKGWTGAITGGATLVRSTTTTNDFTAGVSVVRSVPTLTFLPARNRTVANLVETYGKQASPVIPPTVPASPDIVVKTNIFHADAERDEYFSPRVYVLGDVSFDHNYAQGLSLQQIYGGGVGWTILKSPRQELNAKADAHFERQTFLSSSAGAAASPPLNLIGSTFAENYHRDLPRKLVFTQGAQFLPAWNNTKAFSLNVNAALVLPVYKRLGLQFATTDNYLNDPPQYFKKNSYQFVTAVSYSLH